MARWATVVAAVTEEKNRVVEFRGTKRQSTPPLKRALPSVHPEG